MIFTNYNRILIFTKRVYCTYFRNKLQSQCIFISKIMTVLRPLSSNGFSRILVLTKLDLQTKYEVYLKCTIWLIMFTRFSYFRSTVCLSQMTFDLYQFSQHSCTHQKSLHTTHEFKLRCALKIYSVIKCSEFDLCWPKMKFLPSQKTKGILYSIWLIHTPLIWSSSIINSLR